MSQTVTRDFLNSGMSWQDWLAGMTRNQERFQQNYDATEISNADREFFSNLPEPVDILCIVADWCGDVVGNFPMVGKLVQASNGKLRLHIFLRDDNEEFAAQYPSPDGRNHIPTYIFFDKNMDQLGLFMERPAFITEAMHTWREEFANLHPELPGIRLPVSDMPDETKALYRQFTRERRSALHQEEQEAIFAAFRAILSRLPVSA